MLFCCFYQEYPNPSQTYNVVIGINLTAAGSVVCRYSLFSEAKTIWMSDCSIFNSMHQTSNQYSNISAKLNYGNVQFNLTTTALLCKYSISIFYITSKLRFSIFCEQFQEIHKTFNRFRDPTFYKYRSISTNLIPYFVRQKRWRIKWFSDVLMSLLMSWCLDVSLLLLKLDHISLLKVFIIIPHSMECQIYYNFSSKKRVTESVCCRSPG